MALTFDDGPHPRLTPALLEVLERHGARATFFVLGRRAADHPELLQRICAAGCEVGNHMWDDRPSVRLSRADFERDMVRTDEVLGSAGVRAAFLRPGSGWFRPHMLRAAAAHGHRLALGTVVPPDASATDLDRDLRFLLARVRPGGVVVLHEGRAERAGVVPLTDRLLHVLHEREYRVVSLSELLAAAPARR